MQNCRNCTKQNLWTSTGNTIKGKREWKCRNCGNIQLEEPPQGLDIPAKVLYFDIETALVKATVFDSGKQWVHWKNIESEPFILCWAATWMHKKTPTIISDCITPARVKKQDDREVLKPLYDLMDAADYIVGHNMRPFDWKMVSGRFYTHGWDAPHDPKIVDTLSLSRRRFKEISHSLDAWLKRRHFDGKDKMEREDWERCIRGDQQALNKMVRYCRDDVKRGSAWARDFQRYVEQATGKLLFK